MRRYLSFLNLHRYGLSAFEPIKNIKLVVILLFNYTSVLAVEGREFQQFQNEYNLGYSYQSGQLANGSGGYATFDAKSLNMEVERLFNNGIWIDANLNMVTNYNQPNLGTINGGNGSNIAYGQYPFMMGFNAKAGFAFEPMKNSLQITPYVMLGRTNNWAASTVIANGGHNLSTDYFYSGGLGGRVSYKINPVILIFADELYTYNWDNSGAIKTIQVATYSKTYAATNYSLASTIGIKLNVWRQLQLGVNGFWANFEPQSNISGMMYTPQNTLGTQLTLGLTY